MANTLLDDVRLHDDHRSIFVNGHGGTLKSSEDQAHELSMYVYDHSPQASPKITAVCNQPVLPGDISEDVVKKVLSYLMEPHMVQEGDGRIRLVIFCHSNGAKPVRHALSLKILTNAIKENGAITEESSKKAMKNIRDQVVVVSFGGVSLIPEYFAKLVLNFRAEKDNASKMCHYLGIGTHDGQDTYYRLPQEPDKKREIEAGIYPSLGCASGLGSQLFPTMSSNLPSSSSTSNGDTQHYLDDYIKHEVMVKFMQKMMNIPNCHAKSKSKK